MKKQGMWDEVERTAEIEINGISLRLRANWTGNKIEISYQICDALFKFSEAMLVTASVV
jgi:hypothetical protein